MANLILARTKHPVTTAIINDIEVEYDGMSLLLTDSAKEFYSVEFGWKYLGSGFTHTHSDSRIERPEFAHFWKRIKI